MRDTQRKGDIAVAVAIASFTKLGYDISLPITESAAYDLVVDDNSGLHRVQVRFTSGLEVDLRRIHSNSKKGPPGKRRENLDRNRQRLTTPPSLKETMACATSADYLP